MKPNMQTELGTCPPTGKAMYATRGVAKAVARKMRDGLRAYPCTQCGHFHIGHAGGLDRQWHRDAANRRNK